MAREPETETDDAPPRSSRRLLAIVPGLVLVGLLAYGFLAPADRDASPRAAPEFELKLLSDTGTLSSDDLRGSPVVLNFWASWCVPCREEMPAFEAMWRKYRDQGLQVVGVNVQDSEEGGRDFLAELGITYPVVYDGEATLSKALDVYGLPQTFFIDRDYRFTREKRGKVLEGQGDRVVLGAISREELETNILRLLEEES